MLIGLPANISTTFADVNIQLMTKLQYCSSIRCQQPLETECVDEGSTNLTPF